MASTLARMWSAWTRQPDDVSRMTLADLVALSNSPFASVLPSGSFTRNGQVGEDVENSFASYVASAYKVNGPVFATILARMLLFTEARFQYQRLDKGRPGELFGTADLALLERPWPNGTTGELLARAEQDVSLAGNFYCLNEGDRLRRLRPDWVSIILTADPAEDARPDVAGYMYSPGGNQAHAEFYLPPNVMHWSPIPDPTAQYRGMSWLTPVLEEMSADGMATRHKKKFFENGATLSTVIGLKETVTADQFKEFVRTFNEAHQGADNAYRNLVLGGGADAKVISADLRQLDFRATQGAGETRITSAGGVPAVIVGLSEGLQAATYSNYGQARRKFGDHWGRPQWRSFSAAAETICPPPSGSRLWYDDRDVAFLREDAQDAAQIQQTKASTIRTLVDAGFEPESVIASVEADNRALLRHSHLYSVQLQPPGTVAKPTTTSADDVPPQSDTPPEGGKE
jgi:phage portal protein BeeE